MNSLVCTIRFEFLQQNYFACTIEWDFENFRVVSAQAREDLHVTVLKHTAGKVLPNVNLTIYCILKTQKRVLWNHICGRIKFRSFSIK